MNVYVTGVAGFIGSHIAARLINTGEHWVAGCDNLLTGRIGNVHAEVAFENCDVLEAGLSVNNYLPNLIVHCAASYSDPNEWQRDTSTNVGSAQRIAEIGVPTIYFQTVLPPISSYAATKIAGEHFLRMSEAPLTVFRLANIYGPRNLSGAIPTFYQRVKADQPCYAVNTRRDFVYIDDLADFVLAKLDEPGDYTVASGEQLRMLDVYDTVRELAGGTDDAEQVEPTLDDIAAMPLTPHPDFMPVMPFATGVSRAVEWYDLHGLENTYTHLREAVIRAS